MRLKYYLRGLGTGILFCYLVISLTGANDKPRMSDTEIIHAAKALGMVEAQSQVDLTGLSPTPRISPDQNQNPTTEPTIEPTVEPTAEPIAEPTAEPTTEPTAEATLSPTPIPEPTPTTEPTKAPEIKDAEKKTVTLTIVKGMYSRAVAEEAYRIGLVDSVEEFDKYLIDHGFASKIRINTYEFEIGATAWEIANKITTRQ